jgi:hypothetical protein
VRPVIPKDMLVYNGNLHIYRDYRILLDTWYLSSDWD